MQKGVKRLSCFSKCFDYYKKRGYYSAIQQEEVWGGVMSKE